MPKIWKWLPNLEQIGLNFVNLCPLSFLGKMNVGTLETASLLRFRDYGPVSENGDLHKEFSSQLLKAKYKIQEPAGRLSAYSIAKVVFREPATAAIDRHP